MHLTAHDAARAFKLQALQLVLRPVVRFCFSHALHIQDVVRAVKHVFIEVAEEEIRKSTSKVNVSRISIMTGLYRDEVRRIFLEREEIQVEPASVLGRVIGQWEQDPRFRSKEGRPRVLTCHGDDSEFYELVRLVSKNINPATVLFELERNGAVERTPRGLRFRRPSYSAGRDAVTAYEVLSKDVEDLILAVDENIVDKRENLHIRTEYDNIYLPDLPEIREWIIRQGKRFHKEIRDYLSRFDKDLGAEAPVDRPAGGKVVVTAFSYIEEPAQSAESEQA